MKTPEEIAKALHLCYNPPSSCVDCSYLDYTECTACVAKDAEECIRKLVEENKNLNKWLGTVSNHLAAINEASMRYVEQMADRLPRWISVEERLPDPGDDVAVLINIGENNWMHRAAWVLDDGEFFVLGDVKADCQEIRYWMLLPEIPSEEEGREK